ncbi:monosaccharide ABC transporter substrate-binding protein, CUT2 family [Alkalispirochaeta americana]|uniref:Monosaccharide ABC transporter substrate-binding protein, CUT2 family n=1 Tax=Alkalispirochaeta americana TaxID=159291 RepID=A0A1N6SDS7_9SPIO|nr:substrate-binding domain-containing protein [Alkalispirochaeta americana]SIQ39268.1 monosaccharide ABC transporter substrate-binding protein, CUT2 family [Alkalispirochaeta americana]
MQRYPRLLTLLFGLLFSIALYFSVSTIVSLSGTVSRAGSSAAPQEYHLALFIPDSPSRFFEEVLNGASRAARSLGAALSVHRGGTESRSYRLAQYSGIDGAIIYPGSNLDEMRASLDRLKRAEIPLVLIEHGVTDDLPWPLVGTNTFDVGRKIGELAQDLTDEPLRMALVYSEKSPGIESEKDLVELGINTSLADHLILPIIRKRTGLNPLDAEHLVYNLLHKGPEVDLLVFTDTNDTLAAVQVVIDLNLVGSVQIIGMGMNKAISDYLDRGILAGVIVVNPYRIGFDAVRVLLSHLREGYSAGYVDTGVEMIRGTP